VDEEKNDEVLSKLGADRRRFIKRVVAVTAFAAPMVASYDLENLSPSVAGAVSNTA
jgi:hypothetical protein